MFQKKYFDIIPDEIRKLAVKALADEDDAAKALAENCQAERKTQAEALTRQVMKNEGRAGILGRIRQRGSPSISRRPRQRIKRNRS